MKYFNLSFKVVIFSQFVPICEHKVFLLWEVASLQGRDMLFCTLYSVSRRQAHRDCDECKCIEKDKILIFQTDAPFLGSMRESRHRLSTEVGQMTIMRGRREKKMTQGIRDHNQRIILVVSSHMAGSNLRIHTHLRWDTHGCSSQPLSCKWKVNKGRWVEWYGGSFEGRWGVEGGSQVQWQVGLKDQFCYINQWQTMRHWSQRDKKPTKPTAVSGKLNHFLKQQTSNLLQE